MIQDKLARCLLPTTCESVEKCVARNGQQAVLSVPRAPRVLVQNLKPSKIVSFPTSLRWSWVLAIVFGRSDALTFLGFALSLPSRTAHRHSIVVAIALGAA